MSGVGKGITTSSLGTLFKAKGYNVTIAKADPYLNVDAGTMNPTEHGEVFVLDSGLETDQDMGNYERFLNRDLDEANYMTSGMVYKTVIERERSLGYKGKCVEAVPHIRDEITCRIKEGGEKSKSDISIIEIGGTVGDYQNIMFIEAARVLKLENPEDVAFIMVSFLPIPSTLGEMKSKPTQNAVRQLNSYGINPDFIVARSHVALDDKRKEKIAISCNVPGGFGESGVEGKIAVITYARVNKIPYFGLCYGMQLLVIEYARNVLGLTGAHTTEINKNAPHKVIDIMEDQKSLMQKAVYGGSMRLGAYPCVLVPKTTAYDAYHRSGRGILHKDVYTVSERHRHRFEVNTTYIEQLEKSGLVFSGVSPDGQLMEIAELPKSKHPFFLGTQFHPEFLARPLSPHPLFSSFIKAAIKNKK